MIIEGNNYFARKGYVNERELSLSKSGLPHGFPHVSKSEFPHYLFSNEMKTSTLVSQGF